MAEIDINDLGTALQPLREPWHLKPAGELAAVVTSVGAHDEDNALAADRRAHQRLGDVRQRRLRFVIGQVFRRGRVGKGVHYIGLATDRFIENSMPGRVFPRLRIHVSRGRTHVMLPGSTLACYSQTPTSIAVLPPGSRMARALYRAPSRALAVHWTPPCARPRRLRIRVYGLSAPRCRNGRVNRLR